MRILLITNVFPNPIRPTLGTFNQEMALALCQAGHQLDVVAPVPWVDEWRARRQGLDIGPRRHNALNGIDVFYPRYFYTPKVLRRCYHRFMWHSVRRTLLSLMNARPPDAVLAYWTHPDGAVAVRAARKIGKPCVMMVGGSDVLILSRQSTRRKCIVTVLQSADAVVTVSEHIKARLCELGVDPAKIQVVYRGVDREQFTPGNRREARQRLGLPLDRPLVVWVGRMSPEKGLDVLITACSILESRSIDFVLELVGAGPLEERVKSMCDAAGVSERVHFRGAVSHYELPDWYRAADMTVLPSLSEGVPNVLLESIACGTPFVASRVGGIPEIVSPESDLLVEPSNPVELADAIERRLRQPNVPTVRAFMPDSCRESALRLVDVIRLAAESELGNATSRWSWRQRARRLLAKRVPQRFLMVNGPSDRNIVWLTFDDGPDPQHTPRLLDVLRTYNVPATFFLVGRKAERYPDLVRQIADEGHTVGNHTYHHRALDELGGPALADEIGRTAELLEGVLRKPVALVRPPHGKVSPAALWRLWRRGQRVVLWNTDPKDYAMSSAAELACWLRRHPFQAGDIVLLHDNHPLAAMALPEAIHNARGRGLEFAAI